VTVAVGAWSLHADARVFRDDPAASTAVFTGLLTFSALLASVLLALLAVIAALDARPLVQEIRRAQHYAELVDSALSPLRAFIALAALSVAALLVSSSDREIVRRGLVVIAAWLTTLGILSTARFARLLVRVMIDPAGSQPPEGKNTPEAARERGARDMPLPPGPVKHAPPS
jgi:hypothetical protein